MLKIAHRGAKAYEPENSLVSFEKAIALNAHGIELDVHLSSDKVVVVIHDETINRTTNGDGFVSEYTASELKKHGIPSLSEVLELVKQKCFLNIELKGNETEKPVVDLITHYISQKNWNLADFVVSSFNWKMLEKIQLLNPKIRIGVLTEQSIEDALAFAINIRAFSIHPYYKLLSKENVFLMQENGFEVYPWTVNSKTEIHEIKSFNVNGIISDFPNRI